MGALIFTYTHPYGGTKTAVLSQYSPPPQVPRAVYEDDPGSGTERKWVGASEGRTISLTIEQRDDKYEDLVPIVEAWLELRDYLGTVEITQGAYSKTWTNMSLIDAQQIDRDPLWKAIELTFREVTGT